MNNAGNYLKAGKYWAYPDGEPGKPGYLTISRHDSTIGYFERDGEFFTVEPRKFIIVGQDVQDTPRPRKAAFIRDGLPMDDVRKADNRMVRALRSMEGAIKELESVREDFGSGHGAELTTGEAELWNAYNIVAAKRPLLTAEVK